MLLKGPRGLVKILQYSLCALAVSGFGLFSFFALCIDDVNIPDVTQGTCLRYFLVPLIVLIDDIFRKVTY